MTRDETLDFLTRYLRAVEQGTAGAGFYHHEAVLIEHPNKIAPNGVTRDLGAIKGAGASGQSILVSQTNEIQSALIEGDRAAVQLLWSATFKIDVMGLPAGQTMRARFAQFYTFKDDLIWRQETYDCFEPW